MKRRASSRVRRGWESPAPCGGRCRAYALAAPDSRRRSSKLRRPGSHGAHRKTGGTCHPGRWPAPFPGTGGGRRRRSPPCCRESRTPWRQRAPTAYRPAHRYTVGSHCGYAAAPADGAARPAPGRPAPPPSHARPAATAPARDSQDRTPRRRRCCVFFRYGDSSAASFS